MPNKILVSSYTDEIYTLEFDAEAGTLVQTAATKVGDRPSWVAFHPDDHSILYVVLEGDEGRLLALKDMQIVDDVATNGSAPCMIYVKDGDLFVANYTSGQLFTISVSTSPPYFSPSTSQTIQFHGTGPNRGRQERAHAHDALISGSDLLMPDLGTDKVYRLRKEGKEWEVIDAVTMPPGSGPRHITIHNETLYVLLELQNAVASIPYPPSPADKPTVVPTSAIVVPEMTAAEILISYPYLYASNRDSGHPEGDSIAVFTVDRDGLKRVNEVRTSLRHIRGMAIGGPKDRFIIAGGVKEGGVKVYERKGPELIQVVHLGSVLKPTSFLWAD